MVPEVINLLTYKLLHPHGHTQVEVNDDHVVLTFTPKKQPIDLAELGIELWMAWVRFLCGSLTEETNNAYRLPLGGRDRVSPRTWG